MPKFTTSIRLLEATEKDYAQLYREMKKNDFNPVSRNEKHHPAGITSTSTFNSTRYKSLFDTTAVVSLAASATGKKYSFTVIKEKAKPDA